jgi:hypothetical protein
MVAQEVGDASAGVQREQMQQQEQEPPRDPDASAVVPSQAVPVVGVPTYPNCVKWSSENLLAVGAGHLVTILVSVTTIASIFSRSCCQFYFKD